jgi:hypothetical protein
MEAALDILDGSFQAALSALRQLYEVRLGTSTFWHWLHVTKLYLDLLDEAGKTDEAGRVATDLRRRLPGLPTDPAGEDFAIATSPLPFLLHAQFRAGLVERPEVRREREAWLRGWEQRTKPFFRPFLWSTGYACCVDTAADATEALDAMAQLGPIPPFRPLTASNLDIGRTYLLAGKPDAAVSYLKKAAHGCAALRFPVATVRAQLYLGEALESQDERAGACEAYAAVLSRWGTRSLPRRRRTRRART